MKAAAQWSLHGASTDSETSFSEINEPQLTILCEKRLRRLSIQCALTRCRIKQPTGTWHRKTADIELMAFGT